MSFAGYKTLVEAGDVVILYLSHDRMMRLTVTPGQCHQTKYGALRHDALIGRPYGSKVECTRGYIYVLQPTPELWTINLPHRTQILYSTDIAMVTLQLDLKPGSVVAEAGTGSGSLSHAIIRSIAPHGHLHTFEFHEQRASKAQAEFEQHGLSDCVTVTNRDVCREGFSLQDCVDAVFLDLPKPYEAFHHVKKALKIGGRLCSFSPCIEQVQMSCQLLKKLGFGELHTVECLSRPLEIRATSVQSPDLGIGGYRIVSATNASGGGDSGKAAAAGKTYGPESVKEAGSFKTTTVPTQCVGHTGYLTFSTLFPE